MLDYCFTKHLHIELSDVLHTRSWRWFVTKVSGLLSDEETLIARYFHHKSQQEATEGTDAWKTEPM